jgi:Spy/CpxP family protein refolding chaperone
VNVVGRRLGAFVLFSACLAGLAAAQPPSGGRRSEARDEGLRMIEAYIVSNLQESLGLSDEQFVKCLPLVKRLMSDRRELAERRRRAVRELRQDLESGGATEARVAERLKEVKALEIEERERTRRNLEALDGALTPVQQAKFRVMELEIERRIRDVIAGIRQRRRGMSQP